MNKVDLVRMARDVGATFFGLSSVRFDLYAGELERFAELVAAAEREECALICDAHRGPNVSAKWDTSAFHCAESIRARSLSDLDSLAWIQGVGL